LAFVMLSPFFSSWVFNRYGLFFDIWLPALAVNFLKILSDKYLLLFMITGRLKSFVNVRLRFRR
jgi:hypothetical protein